MIADTLATIAATRNFANLISKEGDGNSNHSTGTFQLYLTEP